MLDILPLMVIASHGDLLIQQRRLRSTHRGGPDRDVPIGSLAALIGYHSTGVLKAVATSAKDLLRSSDLHQSLLHVIERIGLATDVDRTHVFEVDTANPGGRILWHRVWCTPAMLTPPEFQTPEKSMVDVGLGSWVPRLARGEMIMGHTRNFKGAARKLFELGNVKSVLCVPVFVEDRWWGFIGFDDCQHEREWSSMEINAIATLAELIGAAVARMHNLQQLADATHIIENSPTILYRLGAQAPFPLIFLSQNIKRYGYDAAELLAQPDLWRKLIASENMPVSLANIKLLVEGKVDNTQSEFRFRKADGTYVWFEGRTTGLRDDDGQLIAVEGVLMDITDRKQAAEKIATAARTDSLTGLANRAAFLDRLHLEFARAEGGGNSFAILYLDLDHFKDVNDTLGHPAGDELLQAVADRLRACIRATDMIARFGGDEFAVLQDNLTDIRGVEALAIKICETLAVSFSISGNQVYITASIGVVTYREDVEGPDAMIMKADLALYRAKEEGRNRFRFFVDELDREVQERVVVARELHQALERDEFELFYQPQLELATGSIVGTEALIRWNHPTRGLLLPSSFIPIAESNGSILPIGEWVIEQACRQIKLWQDLAIAPPTVAVNISATQFKLVGDLDEIVAEYLAKYAVRPDQLELELTESALLETTERNKDVFERLRRIGVRLAIDDFGTGYSCLDYLRSFHVARLKIDRRFINDMTTNPDNAIIVRATISLAHELGIVVVAEGIETAEQKAYLMSIGCRIGQGYYLGPPLPADRASTLLQSNRPWVK
ncbi:MAG: EAL domain-containing protein [Beijerinckiaceae bacterium]